MVQQVVTRTQRRTERKQLVLVVVLILVVAGVSFSLGVMYGQKNRPATEFVNEPDIASLPAVAKIDPPPRPDEDAAPEKPEELTFYDNLPKGKQAPLGSGINLPPGQKADGSSVERKTASLTAPSTARSPQHNDPAPVIAPAGAFVVQVASFRTSEDAAKLADHLKKYRLKMSVEKADLGAKGVWYRVLSGPFGAREQADNAVNLLREKERLAAIVRQRN